MAIQSYDHSPLLKPFCEEELVKMCHQEAKYAFFY